MKIFDFFKWDKEKDGKELESQDDLKHMFGNIFYPNKDEPKERTHIVK